MPYNQSGIKFQSLMIYVWKQAGDSTINSITEIVGLSTDFLYTTFGELYC